MFKSDTSFSLFSDAFQHRFVGIWTAAIVVALIAVSACGVDSHDGLDGANETISDEAVGRRTQALTDVGSGLVFVGNFQIKSAVAGNYCIEAVNNYAVTRACSSSANQIGAVYQLPNQRYQFCYPNTLQVKRYQTYGFQWEDYYQSSAICLATAGTRLQFAWTSLTVNGYGGSFDFTWNTNHQWMAFGSSISAEANGVLGWSWGGLIPSSASTSPQGSGDKITRGGKSGDVILSPATGALSQSWTMIPK